MKKSKIVKSVRLVIPAFALILTASTLVFLSGCKDEENGTDPVVGVWVISSAELNETTPDEVPEAYTGGAGQTVLPAGTNVTPIFIGIVATAGPCANPANTAIELTSDQKMLYVCLNETTDPDETGTWLVSQDGSTLTISIQTTTPGLPSTVSLSLSSFTVSGNTLSGTIDDFAFFPSAENQFGIQTVSMDVEFTKATQ